MMAADHDPDRMTRGARRGFVILALAMLAIGAASVMLTVVSAAQLRAQQLAACGFAADLGSAPLPAVPRPSRLGVSIVADSRAWWHRNACPGSLPPPSPGLARWAAYYRLPVS